MTTNEEIYHDEAEEDRDDLLQESVGSLLSPSSSIVGGSRRLSLASIKFFQTETSTRRLSLLDLEQQQQQRSKSAGGRPSISSVGVSTRNLVACLDGCDHGLIGSDGRVRDEYILQRQSVNRPAALKKVPLLCDLSTASEITQVDGWAFTMLVVAGFVRMASKVDELNAINVFPIADGDTGANMKVCLKLPARNLLLNPTDNILLAASNVAADVLLNGQGNSGTILSHFFVSLAEEVRDAQKSFLSIDEFAACLSGAGRKMDAAVPNPVEGTLLSVCRDSCAKLDGRGPYSSLADLLGAWNDLATTEVASTPDKLVVDGVRVLERAGVVDSGAQGFAYLVEGMHLASRGELPNLMDAGVFASAQFIPSDEAASSIDVDHTVTDSRFRFCTECVVLLKDGVDASAVLDEVKRAVEDGLGDSVASVKAPAKEGGEMVKVHVHSNDPEAFYDRIRPYSRDPAFKKEKVEDMLVMRELMHGDSNFLELGDAMFTIMGLCSYVLPPLDDMDELYTLPVFLVPETTQEPIDLRFVSDTDACVALNHQRHPETAIRYTTAASNPMQIKIELLAALGNGKPLLVFLMSTDKRISAIGRNTMAAIDMLEPEQKDLVKVFVHGWGFFEAPFILEAMRVAQDGGTIDDAYDACKAIADRNFSFSNFVTSATVKKLLAWRPGLFPKGFSVEDGCFVGFGIPVTTREEVLGEFQRVGMLMTVQQKEKSMAELQDAEIQRIKKDLKPGEKIRTVLVQTVGRPDYGYRYVEKMRKAGVPMTDDAVTTVYNGGMFSCATSNWGEVCAQYIVVVVD